MVFVDISGFTALSERLARFGREGAEEITALLQEVFESLLAVAYDNDGSLIKFGGDALFLLFEGPGHPLRAARSADGMRRRLLDMGALTTMAGKVRLGMTVGAHTGEFDLFLVGESHRELVVAGPAASRVVRLEESAAAGQVVISEDLAVCLDGAWVAEAAGEGRLLLEVPSVAPASPTRTSISERGAQELVPTAIRDHVLGGGGAAEHRHADVAFVAFAGVDELLAAKGPAAVAAAIGDLVDVASVAADDHEITFVGSDVAPDGGKLILVGGVPVGHDDDAERVLRAARTIAASDSPLSVKIGVHGGPLFAGLIGPSYRLTWTVMGDTVNLAARLAYKAAPSAVLATNETLARTRTRFTTQPVPAFVVKGKQDPIEASIVGPPRAVRQRHTGVLPLLGREAELAVMDRAAAAATKVGQLVEVAGPAGIGKTRLLEEFRDRHADLPMFWGSCGSFEATTPYVLFRDLLRFLLRLDGTDDAAALPRHLADIDPALEPWAPLVAMVVDVPVPMTPQVQGLDDRFVATRLRDVVTDVLGRVLPTRAIIRFEDVQWIDSASEALLGHLLDHVLPQTQWIVIVTTRGPLRSDRAGHLIELQPLDASAVRRLADVAAERGLVSIERARDVAVRAEGNPLFLEELLSFATSSTDDVPDTVERLVGARIDRLPPRHRDLLRLASLLGAQFELGLLEQISDAPIAAEDIAGLDDFLTIRDDGSLEFRHTLHREVAYAALPYRRRRHLHAQTGRFLEQQFHDRPEEVAERLALHYHRGRCHDLAWRFNRVAAAKARAAHANGEAVNFLQWALESGMRARVATAPERVAILLELAELFEILGAFERAEDVLRRARRLASPDGRPPIWYRSGILRERRGRYREALRWYSRAQAALAADGADPVLELRVEQRRAEVRLMQGRAAEVRDGLERMLPRAVAIGDPDLLANAHYDLVWGLALDRDVDAHAREARIGYLALGRQRDLGRLETIVGMRAWEAGDLSESARSFVASEQAFSRAGDPVGAANATMNASWPLLAQGRYEELEELLESSGSVFRAAGFVIGAAQVDGMLGYVAATRGDFAAGEQQVAAARDALIAAEVPNAALDLQIWLAEIALWRGDLDSACQQSSDLLASARDERSPELLGAVRVRGLSRGREGVEELEQAHARAAAAGQELEVALLASALAHVLGEQEERARSLLLEARTTFERLGVVVDPRTRVLGPAAT